MVNLARFLARWAALGHKLGALDFEKAGFPSSFAVGLDRTAPPCGRAFVLASRPSWVRHIPLDIIRYRGVFALVGVVLSLFLVRAKRFLRPSTMLYKLL